MGLWKKYDGKGFFAEIAEKDQNGNNIAESLSRLNTLIDNIGSPLTYSGSKTVDEVNDITSIKQGTVYTVSNSGTITGMDSNIDVDQSDEIAYAVGQGWVKIGKDFLYDAYYTKAETSGAAEISAALALKEDKVFIAEYGVTPYADIKDAYDSGKQIVCKYISTAQDQSEDVLYFTSMIFDSVPGVFVFNKLTGPWTSFQIYVGNNIPWNFIQTELQTNLSAGTDLVINNGVISVNTNGSAVGTNSFVIGINTLAQGNYSFAAGSATSAIGTGAFAEGTATSAVGNWSHAEGDNTKAIGKYSHAECNTTSAIGDGSHAEGYRTKAVGYQSHAEGASTSAIGYESHAEGANAYAYGDAAHAEGWYTKTSANYGHAEGFYTIASGRASHAEGYGTRAVGWYSHAEGQNTSAYGEVAHAEGYLTKAYGQYSHAEGESTSAIGHDSHAEGNTTSAVGDYSHVGGISSIAEGSASFAHGYSVSANGNYSYAEGKLTIAASHYSHAEGFGASAIGDASHAEGDKTKAIGEYSHAEGTNTMAAARQSHAEGGATHAAGVCSHAEGSFTSAVGHFSHAEGQNTIAGDSAMHVGGKYNATSSNAAFVIGNGIDDANRSDAFIVDWNGTASATKLATSGLQDVEQAIKDVAAINTYEVVNGSTTADITNPTTKTIYLIKDTSVIGDDKYEEWIYTSASPQTTAFEKIGDTSINLSDYVTKTEYDNLYNSYTALSASFADLSATFVTYSGQWLIGTTN